MLDILVVDDDELVREPIAEALASAGHHVAQAADGEAALAMMAAHGFDLAVCDVRMPRVDGLTLLRRARRESPDTDVVLMTSYGRVPDAIGSLRDGALDYVTKPFDPEDFTRRVVGPIDQRRGLERSRRAPPAHGAPAELVGTSHVIREVGRRIAMLAFSEVPVLVTGQLGTGKRLVARALHARSSRRLGPEVFLDCRTFDPTHPDEAQVRSAMGGTLVLDGLEALSGPAQQALLRALRAHPPRTAERWAPLGIRVVALATTGPGAPEGTGLSGPLLRELDPVRLRLPPLTDRQGDLYVLTAHFLRELGPGAGVRATLSPSSWRALEQHPFPGNVGELRWVLEAALAAAGGGSVGAEHLEGALRAAGARLEPEGRSSWERSKT